MKGTTSTEIANKGTNSANSFDSQTIESVTSDVDAAKTMTLMPKGSS